MKLIPTPLAWVWLPLVISACHQDDPEPPHPVDGNRTADCLVGETLVLDLVSVVPAPFHLPPMDLTRLDDTTFLALDHIGDVYRVRPSGADDHSPGSWTLVGLGTLPGGNGAFSESQIFRHLNAARQWEEVETDTNFSEIRGMVAGDSGDSTLWVLDGPEEVRRVILLKAVKTTDDVLLMAQTWDLPGSWRLVPTGLGEALAISLRPPFEIVGLVEGNTSIPLGLVGKATPLDGSGEDSGVYMSGAVGLDCDAALLSIADTRSNDRWLIVLDTKSGEVRTRARVDASMGFFAADRGGKNIFAYRGIQEGGEVLTYRWTWGSTPTTPTEREEP